MLIGANHTHSGGPVGQLPRLRRESGLHAKRWPRAIADAVSQAWNSLHAAEAGVGFGAEPNLSFNRRFLMRDGREITHPGKPGTPHHDDIVGPAGPIDPDVGVLALRNPAAKNKVAGVVVHFACHSTVVGGDQFSPDYAGYLRKHIKTHYGEDTPVVFLLGPCGDITQVDNLSANSEFGRDYADLMGMKLAGEAIRTVERMTWLKAGADRGGAGDCGGGDSAGAGRGPRTAGVRPGQRQHEGAEGRGGLRQRAEAGGGGAEEDADPPGRGAGDPRRPAGDRRRTAPSTSATTACGSRTRRATP